jgi:cephalosporin hydroxylase
MINHGNKVMIIEDSSHEYEPTLRILEKYGVLVSSGCYFVVEDSIIKEPYIPGPKPGPHEAIHKFLEKNKQFKIDKTREKFLFTYNPDGFLLKI